MPDIPARRPWTGRSADHRQPHRRYISIALSHPVRTLDEGPYALVVTYKDGVKHRQEYINISELLQDLADRVADHEQYGSVKHWKVIP